MLSKMPHVRSILTACFWSLQEPQYLLLFASRYDGTCLIFPAWSLVRITLSLPKFWVPHISPRPMATASMNIQEKIKTISMSFVSIYMFWDFYLAFLSCSGATSTVLGSFSLYDPVSLSISFSLKAFYTTTFYLGPDSLYSSFTSLWRVSLFPQILYLGLSVIVFFWFSNCVSCIDDLRSLLVVRGFLAMNIWNDCQE